MFDKKTTVRPVSPDLNKLKAVIIDRKTTIYIDKDMDSDEARRRYVERRSANIKI